MSECPKPRRLLRVRSKVLGDAELLVVSEGYGPVLRRDNPDGLPVYTEAELRSLKTMPKGDAAPHDPNAALTGLALYHTVKDLFGGEWLPPDAVAEPDPAASASTLEEGPEFEDDAPMSYSEAEARLVDDMVEAGEIPPPEHRPAEVAPTAGKGRRTRHGAQQPAPKPASDPEAQANLFADAEDFRALKQKIADSGAAGTKGKGGKGRGFGRL